MDDRTTDAVPETPGMTRPEEPSGRACPRMVLTPVPEPRTSFEPVPRAVRLMVTGVAVLAIVAEMRRTDTPARPAVLCSAAALALAVVPWKQRPVETGRSMERACFRRYRYGYAEISPNMAKAVADFG